jgi:aspartyl-tRNA(Asn)/glutamyl-tRNA(Gln) amidotransferase subunit B
MEKGLMRFEANISLKPATDTTDRLPSYKVEVKNLNSFKALRNAIDFEIKRQSEILDQNKTPAQETRGWDDVKNRTYAQREKENAHDYRYFPDPDLTPMTWMKSLEPQLRATMPELPWVKRARYQQDYGLSSYDAHVLTLDKNVANFFENTLAQVPEDSVKIIVKKIVNWLTVEVGRLVNEHQIPLQDSKLQPNHLLTIVQKIESSLLSNTNAKILLSELFLNGGDPESIIQSQNLAQVTDQTAVHAAIQKVLTEQAKAVAEYKSGKTTVIQFLIGMTMKELKGKGDASSIRALIEKVLK